ncbi:hypothetical protein SAMD00023353_1100980 [Rosellinia necatrix]|uniref:Uncharacterized protein n=1 Tax=Rosellinia necatrix TaxID=77044 RepID=A0A1S7UMK1_ROSNE|nr:hypothetical protein SAMD00023353_1100980 [Rosellinia necatrix]
MVGSIAAISQLTGQFVGLATTLRYYIKVIRRAPEEVKAFLMDTTNFAGMLGMFSQSAQRAVQAMEPGERNSREKHISEIEEQCVYIHSKMKYLVDRFAGLAREDMTRLESLLERIRYLFNKPGFTDLRLSVQKATISVNAASTLFMWEQAMKHHTDTETYLAQLKNLVPLSRHAHASLAEHQRRHGAAYESGVPKSDSPILATSGIQRHISRVIRPHSRRVRKRPDRLVSGEPGELRPRSLPPESRCPAESTSEECSTISPMPTDYDSSDHEMGTPHDDAIYPAVNSSRLRPLPVGHASWSDGNAGHIPQRGLAGKPSGGSRRPEAGTTSDEGFAHLPRTSSSRRYFSLDVSDPMKPRIQPCAGPRAQVYSQPSHDELHWSKETCLITRLMVPGADGVPDANGSRESTSSESRKEAASARSSRTNPRLSHDGHVQDSPPTTPGSEGPRRPSDHDPNSTPNLWGRTSPALPGSTSDGPSGERRGSQAKENRKPTTPRTESNGPHDPLDPAKTLGIHRPQPGHAPEHRQARERAGRPPLAPIRESQRRQPGAADGRPGTDPARREPHTWDDGEEMSSDDERPRPHVPVTPFAGPDGRHQPRRRRSRTDTSS